MAAGISAEAELAPMLAGVKVWLARVRQFTSHGGLGAAIEQASSRLAYHLEGMDVAFSELSRLTGAIGAGEGSAAEARPRTAVLSRFAALEVKAVREGEDRLQACVEAIEEALAQLLEKDPELRRRISVVLRRKKARERSLGGLELALADLHRHLKAIHGVTFE